MVSARIHNLGAAFAALVLLVMLQGLSQSATAAITITPSTLPSWTLNKSGYLQALAGSGGTAPYSFTVTAGALPNGLALSAAGVLSGTPTVASTFNFTVKATDSLAATGTQAYVVTINPVVAIAPASLPNWTVNKSGYSQTITAANGTGAKTLVISSGTLPPGLTFTPATGVLAGTPTATGPFSFTIKATDSVGATGTQIYSVTINAAVGVTPASLPDWTLNKSGYLQTITGTNGTGAKTFSVSTGAIPTGLTLASGTGILSGTPAAAGTFNFTITATDTVGATGAQAYVVAINPPVSIATATLSNWTLYLSGYSRTVTTSGGTGAATFTVTAGALPGGLALSSAGLLSGTPNAAGTFNFTLTAKDSVGATGAQAYTIIINPALSFATATLPNWTLNTPGYSRNLTVNGGTGAATFAVTAGALPAGLSLTSAGLLSGTPSALGTLNVTITATDSLGATGTLAYWITINPGVSITTATLPDWTISKTGYLQTVAITGGTGASAFTVTSGSLPDGLTLTSPGILSGTPTATGTFGFTITATDVAGSASSQAYNVTINPAVTVNLPALPNWTAGLSGYSQTFISANGTGARRFSVSLGTIPTGLTFATGTGVLSGTPAAAGTFNFTITATDAVGATATQACTIVINPALSIAPTTLPSLTLNFPNYSQNISAIGGTGAATLSVTAGILPTGLVLTPGGQLSGTPSLTGTFNFTITARDSVGATRTQAYTVSVNSGTPTVVAPTSTAVLGTSAVVGGTVLTDGGGTISVVGAVLAPTAINRNPQIDGTGVITAITNGTTGVFTLSASSLTPDTDYTFAAFATNNQGTSYSSVATFTTPSNNASLANLILGEATLSPGFASNIKNYTAAAANSTAKLTVIGIVAQANETVQVNGVGTTPGNANVTIPLIPGLNNITLQVTSQDGTTTSVYTLAVTRQPAFVAVQQPVGTPLVNGASTTDFGNAGVGKPVARVFSVKNLGATALTNFVFAFYGADPGDFSVTTVPAASLAAGASTTFTLTFNPAALGARTATVQIDATGETQNPFTIDLTGNALATPVITTPPASLLVGVGQPAAFSVVASGDAVSYRWLKNNVVISSATSATHNLASAALPCAGVYTAVVTNVAGSATSLPANLGVVNIAPATVTVINGNTLTLTASAAGPNLSYKWQKNSVDMADSLGAISGSATSKLIISKAGDADADTYTCLVTMPDPQNQFNPLTLSSGVFTVKVTDKPVINAFVPGPWIVGGAIADVVTALNDPTSFTLTGQPAGITIDAGGHFLGRPRLAITTSATYHLVITATNAAGASAPLRVDVTVNPLPAIAVGTFNGLVDRDANLTTGYGGSINVVTTLTGTLTGKLNLGASHYSFTGQLDPTPDGVTTPATVTIIRASPSHNLVMALTFHHDLLGDAAHAGEMDGSIADVSLPGSPVNCLAWRCSASPTFATVYTAALEIDSPHAGTANTAGNIVYPQGNGYGTLTVTTAGAATWVGKMADGTATAAKVTMGPHGEVPLHFMLCTNTASAHGWVQASGTDPNLLLDSVGTFDWMKSVQTGSTLNYMNGFPLHTLTVIGAKYIKPTAASPVVLGLSTALPGPNAQLLFSEGGLAALTYTGTPAVSIVAAAHAADLTNNGTFRLTGTATANTVVWPISNPATISLSVTAATGAFSGGFILHGDQDPTKATSSPINRTATFSGVCITRSSGSSPLTAGVGFFLLPELQPYPGLAVTASPLLSGQVFLQQWP